MQSIWGELAVQQVLELQMQPIWEELGASLVARRLGVAPTISPDARLRPTNPPAADRCPAPRLSLWERPAAGRVRVFLVAQRKHPHPGPLPEGEGGEGQPRSSPFPVEGGFGGVGERFPNDGRGGRSEDLKDRAAATFAASPKPARAQRNDHPRRRSIVPPARTPACIEKRQAEACPTSRRFRSSCGRCETARGAGGGRR